MATLKDIGAELGLSAATVSRALNGFPEVNAKTRTRVRETADRLGYSPNKIAQRLVTGRSGMVGMIAKINAEMTADQTILEILTGLTAALSARDVDLVFAVENGDDPIAPYKSMIERGILDGFILNAPQHDDPRVNYLKSKDIPFVVHGRDRSDVDYPFYGIDNAAVSSDSVAFLADLGHRRIAHLNGDTLFTFSRSRARGFLAEMTARGLTVPDQFRRSESPSESYGYTQALAILSGRHGPRPTAVVCASTLIASGVFRAAADLGLEVPADLSVIAHDDALPDYRALEFAPPLTVTRSPLRDACVPLANHLIDHISGADIADLQTLARAEVIVRSSTGPVPQGGATQWP